MNSEERDGDGAARATRLYLDLLRGALLDEHYIEHELRIEPMLMRIRNESVVGDLVDAGGGRGGAAVFMRGFLEALEMTGRQVWVVDPPDLNVVRDALARFALFDERVVFSHGPSSRIPSSDIALLRLGSDDPRALETVLDQLYDRVSPGGFVVVDHYGAAECQEAVDAFRSRCAVSDPLERLDWSGVAWRKTADAVVQAPAPPKSTTKDLAIVVVVYNMRREARRTLHSLSRAYQRGIDELDYEVIVVENGSAPHQRLGEELVRSFGDEFRYIDLADGSTASPAAAVNRGLAASDAANVAVMIDGAHVLTPGVLRFAMLGLSVFAPAVIGVKQWYVGPGQQPQMVAGGYDSQYEDGLFEQIRWPSDGYRLFEISHFIADRDWFDGDWESNCIIVPRALVDQVGGMDESFSLPGGGFANLDFFERMVRTPEVTFVTLLGEGSFHQVHGGTTTNLAEPDELIKSYGDQYRELRGRQFSVPPQQTHYIGTLPLGARRTKARRLTSFHAFRRAQAPSGERRPLRPVPVPQDLRAEFIDAFWRSGEWHRTQWLGRSTHRAPTDLVAYQELVYCLRPEWIVQTRTGSGGLALFLASICELIDHGEVVSIEGYGVGNPPGHARITYLRGDPAAPETAEQAREIISAGSALVILGGGTSAQVLDAFRNYAPLVPVGSYVVVEDTILQGNPVWADFGPGPAAAVSEIVEEGEFVADHSLERFGLTFNIRGFLKRVR